MALPNDFRWKKVRTLGQGGQATVYEVEDKSGALSGTYALKPLKEGASEKAYQRFYREITAMKAVKHTGVVDIIECSQPDAQFHYYVMELIPGAVTLHKLLNTNKNPFHDDGPKSLNLFEQLANVIGAVKDVGIVHRDLSPKNILITPEGSVKVIDFGICQIEGETRITLVDEGVGTINYIAPECESGAGGVVSFKSDLYSAGKILWSAVTNQMAFAREAAVYRNKSMSQMSTKIQTWHLHHIFEGTIRHNPNDRFDSVAEALRICNMVRMMIELRKVPAEWLLVRCPICFIGDMVPPQGWPAQVNHPYTSNLPNGIEPVQCNYCGYFQAIAKGKVTAELNRRVHLT